MLDFDFVRMNMPKYLCSIREFILLFQFSVLEV